MATATNIFSHNDRREATGSENSTSRRVVTPNTHSTPPRPGQHLDDADLLAWKHQYVNIGLREQNVMSNSADDLTQLVDHLPYQLEGFGQDYNDVDDDELHFDNGNTYDYETSIQDRLKKANEDLQQDDTPAELRHQQRVSFDANVKAVDINQDSQELDNTDSSIGPAVSSVTEESSTSPPNESIPHEYTVPLNDTQPKEGPTLLEQLKAMQFHGVPPIGERRSLTNPDASSMREEDLSSTKSNSNNNSNLHETSDMTTKSSSSSRQSMVVAINGGFELQNEDDYTAKRQTRFQNDDKKPSTANTKGTFSPAPPTGAKQRQDLPKPSAPQRPYSSITRPKSSDSSKRTNHSNRETSGSWSEIKTKTIIAPQQRAKSAGVSKSLDPIIMRPSSGVDYNALNRKAALERKAKEQEKRRQEKEAEENRKIQLAIAKESFEKWIQDKDAERKRLIEEKRLEKEEQDARKAQCEKELAELREKKYQEWVERKNRDVLIANEFKKLQADDEEMASGGSSSSVPPANRRENHRAFNRWLRRKYEQSREEQRQLRLEARRLRRRHRRSIKRFRLQQDLQLARSFGYS